MSKLQPVKKLVKFGATAVVSPKRARRTVKKIQYMRQTTKKREQDYLAWSKRQELNERQLNKQRTAANNLKYQPLISVLVPLYNTPESFLRECLDTVLAQTYTNWELCIVDDASPEPHVKKVAAEYAKSSNVKFISLKKNLHIVGATNEALKVAKGEFVALLDHDDLLTPDALYEMVKALNENPEIDFLYSDEDKVDEKGKHIEPFFKPDWSPDYLLACNYITHFAVLRRSIVDKINGFRLGTEGAQDWDLFLRFTQQTNRIHHVPKILYSWRKSETSTAKNAKSKPYAYISQLRVLRDSLVDSKTSASVYGSPFMGFWQVKYPIQKMPLVSIVIPTKDNYELIRNCLESVLECSTYPNFEIVLIDTNSTDQKTLEFYKSKLVRTNRVKIINWEKPFNFSAVCNLGAKESSGEYLLFLNNDTEVKTPDWIEQLLGLAQQKANGMVGCKLLFPNKHIQHAGVVLSERDIAFHPFYGTDPKLDIYTNVYISNIRNCSAVTAACSMVSKKKFDQVGGFDEELSVTYNDVDLCLKLLQVGYRNVYTPYAKLYHHESMSVGRVYTDERDQNELENAKDIIRKRWGELLKRDPYYNDNFIQHGPGYELKP